MKTDAQSHRHRGREIRNTQSQTQKHTKKGTDICKQMLCDTGTGGETKNTHT